MLKKVALANTNTGRTSFLIVDTDDDDKAISGSGRAANESAKVSTINGLDEVVHRLTTRTVSYTHLTLPTNREV